MDAMDEWRRKLRPLLVPPHPVVCNGFARTVRQLYLAAGRQRIGNSDSGFGNARGSVRRRSIWSRQCGDWHGLKMQNNTRRR
jgi:hypothetical protein